MTLTSTSTMTYIHGSGDKEIEQKRLRLQANLMRPYLWDGVSLANLPYTKNLFLEVGCGVGAQTPDLLDRIPQATKVIGIDYDPLQIQKAHQTMADFPHFRDRVSFETMDAADLSFDDNSFDGAYICWVLEHMPHDIILKTFSELKRVVKKGGTIIINETDATPIKSVIFRDKNTHDFPLETLRFFNAMLAEQKKSGGNGAFGDQGTMLYYMTLGGFKKFSYRRIVIDLKESDPMKKNLVEGATKLLESVLPALISSGRFKDEYFIKVKEEISTSDIFHWEGSQVIIENI